MKKYDLSVVIPGIRVKNWKSIYDQLKLSCKKFSYEIIFSSPYELPDELKDKQNIKHILDYGSPSRCLQHSTTVSEAEMVAIMSDDCIIFENSIDSAIEELKNSNDPYKNIVALRYTEGANFIANPNDFSFKYWIAKTHTDLRLEGIQDNWKLCIMFLMNTDRFKELGGIDCRFEHFNMNLHDLAFRAQRDGSDIIISKNFITAQDWNPNVNIDNNPTVQAYHFNDKPLFYSIYSTKEAAEKREIKINYDNWKSTEEVWKRRIK